MKILIIVTFTFFIYTKKSFLNEGKPKLTILTYGKKITEK